MLKGRPRVITQLLNNFRHNVQASILMMSAILMPVIIGMAGLGLDASHWMMTQRTLQNAVDAAVLAAAWETVNNMDENVQDAAEREAANNGWDASKNGTLVLSNDIDADGQPVITGVLQQKADVYLTRMIHGSDIYIATTAAATITVQPDPSCLQALSNAAEAAILFQGNVTVDSSGCGMAINSNNSCALDHNGGAYDASFSTVTIVGSACGMTCGNGNLSCSSMKTNAGSTPDPYSDLDIPTHSTTALPDPDVGNNDVVTIDPGTYDGLSIQGGTLNLNPGVYYIQDHDMHLTGGATINGTGVTLIFTSSDGTTYAHPDVGGSSTLNLTPPTTGDTAGVSIYVDRNAPTAEAGSGTHCENKFIGNGGLNVTGAIYVPSQCIEFQGSNSTSSGGGCTRIIGDTVVISGDSHIENNCSSTGVRDINRYVVKLTL